MGILTVEQIVSADGYAAEPDGGLGFFEEVEVADPSDPDQLAFLERVDAIVLGANTYRMFAGYWPTADPAVEPVAEPINRLPKYVVSNTLDAAPWGDTEVELLRGDGAASVASLKERHQGIVVWGSLTLTYSLFAAGLVDELRLRIVPVLIGAGWSFTPASLGHARLSLESAATHPSGHVGLTYRLR